MSAPSSGNVMEKAVLVKIAVFEKIIRIGSPLCSRGGSLKRRTALFVLAYLGIQVNDGNMS
jgi:hypothetical protein